MDELDKPPAGKPYGTLAYEIEDLEKYVNLWIDSFKEGGVNEGKRPLLTALSYYLNLSKRTLATYSKRPDVGHIIQRARAFCEMHCEEALFDPKIRPAGPIFNLKANYEWKDGNELNVNVNVGWASVLQKASDRRKQLQEPADGSNKLIDI